MKLIRNYLKPTALLVSIMMFSAACSFRYVGTSGILKSMANIPEGSRPMGLVHAEVWAWNVWYADDTALSQKVFTKLQEETRKRGGDAVVDVPFRSEIHDWFLLIVFFVPILLGWTEVHASGMMVKFQEKTAQSGEEKINQSKQLPLIIVTDN